MRDSLLEDIHEESTEESLVELLSEENKKLREDLKNKDKFINLLNNEINKLNNYVNYLYDLYEIIEG